MTAEIIFIQFTFHLICFYFIIEQTGEAGHDKKYRDGRKTMSKSMNEILCYLRFWKMKVDN